MYAIRRIQATMLSYCMIILYECLLLLHTAPTTVRTLINSIRILEYLNVACQTFISFRFCNVRISYFSLFNKTVYSIDFSFVSSGGQNEHV